VVKTTSLFYKSIVIEELSHDWKKIIIIQSPIDVKECADILGKQSCKPYYCIICVVSYK